MYMAVDGYMDDGMRHMRTWRMGPGPGLGWAGSLNTGKRRAHLRNCLKHDVGCCGWVMLDPYSDNAEGMQCVILCMDV